MGVKYMKRLINESKEIVCLLGRGVSAGSGCDIYNERYGYEIEQKYGESIEEIFTIKYYNNRPQEFFQFYMEEILKHRGKPNEAHYALSRMEEQGKLRQIITRSFFDLSSIAGCKNVIKLNGSIYENTCPKCGEKYDYTYMMREPLPLCESCGSIVAPSILLGGELMDNMKVSIAASNVEKANLLLVLGGNMHSYKVENFLKYFNGENIILINNESSYDDCIADCVCIGEIPDILKNLI